MRKRNTFAFTGLAWASFILALSFILVGIWNADWELVEKGFYAGSFLWGVSAAFVLAKVVRDNEEDRDQGIMVNLPKAKKDYDN
jgi:uncharacterized membrane protein YiaA